MEKLTITHAKRMLEIEDVCMDGSTFTNVCGKALIWDDVNLTGSKIKNAKPHSTRHENANYEWLGVCQIVSQ